MSERNLPTITGRNPGASESSACCIVGGSFRVNPMLMKVSSGSAGCCEQALAAMASPVMAHTVATLTLMLIRIVRPSGQVRQYAGAVAINNTPLGELEL
jgi:hypothetical protein